MTLADRVVVMNNGKIEQVGTPGEVYQTPKTRFVAGFIGSPAMNFIDCTLIEANGGLAVRVGETLVLPLPADRQARYRPHLGRALLLGLRPEHLRESRPGDDDAGTACTVTPDVVEPLGMETMVYCAINGTEVCARVAPEAGPRPGEPLALSVAADSAHLIDPETDLVL